VFASPRLSSAWLNCNQFIVMPRDAALTFPDADHLAGLERRIRFNLTGDDRLRVTLRPGGLLAVSAGKMPRDSR